jgi:hypothetical protein
MKKILFFASFSLLALLLLLSSRMGGQAASLTEIPETEWQIYMPFIAKPSPIANHNFEKGPVGWQQSSDNEFELITDTGFDGFGVTPRSGSWLAWLGAGDIESVIGQELTVPANTPYLTYWYWIESTTSCGFDFGGVKINDQRLFNDNLEEFHQLCQDENTNGWALYGVDLSAYAGQTITLQLYARTDEAALSHLFIEDLVFTAVP